MTQPLRLRFLGKDSGSQVTDCPAIYATNRQTYVVQGWKVTDPAALGDVRQLAENETVVEIPENVLEHYIRDRAEHGAAATSGAVS